MMKTIAKLACEFVEKQASHSPDDENKDLIYLAFIAGAKASQEWISVETVVVHEKRYSYRQITKECLAEMEANIPFIVKYDDDAVIAVYNSSYLDELTQQPDFEFWRPIEYK